MLAGRQACNPSKVISTNRSYKENPMAHLTTGRCLCGHVAYAYDGPIGPVSYCHCSDCRRCTGSAFNIGVRFRLADFQITRGNPNGFTKAGERATSVQSAELRFSPLPPSIRTAFTSRRAHSTTSESWSPRSRTGFSPQFRGARLLPTSKVSTSDPTHGTPERPSRQTRPSPHRGTTTTPDESHSCEFEASRAGLSHPKCRRT